MTIFPALLRLFITFINYTTHRGKIHTTYISLEGNVHLGLVHKCIVVSRLDFFDLYSIKSFVKLIFS